MTEELPDGWVRTTLGEVCDVVSGATPKTSEQSYWGGEISWITPDDLAKNKFKVVSAGRRSLTQEGFDSCSAKMVAPGSVLFSSRAPIGYVAIAGTELCTNQGFKNLIPPAGIDSNFLYWYMVWRAPEVASRASGTTFKEISAKGVSVTEILLPPLDEQRRIAEEIERKISSIRSVFSNVSKVRDKIGRLKGSVLASAVRGELSPGGLMQPQDELTSREISEEGYSRTPRRKNSVLPELIKEYETPAGWSLASLSELSYDFGYGTSVKCSHNASGVGVIRIPNVVNGEIDLRDMKYALDESLGLESLHLSPSDLIFVRTNGSRDLIGRSALVRESMGFAFASYLIRFRLALDVQGAEWVQMVLDSPLWRQRIEGEAASSAGQYNISSKFLSALPIPLPPEGELALIKSFVREIFDKVARVEAVLDDVLRRSERLSQTLLTSAFTGKLVSQNPSDEPASALLERIRAERAAAPKSKGGRKSKPSKASTPVTIPDAPRPVPAGEQTALEF